MAELVCFEKENSDWPAPLAVLILIATQTAKIDFSQISCGKFLFQFIAKNKRLFVKWESLLPSCLEDNSYLLNADKSDARNKPKCLRRARVSREWITEETQQFMSRLKGSY